MEKEIKLYNNDFTTLYEDKREKYSNRIFVEESDNFSFIENEIKPKNCVL
jgi:hypothetical protein